MSIITIQRAYFGDCTIGRLRTNTGFQCMTLELPWLGNERRISCIPEGEYPYRVARSPSRGTDVIWIDYVPDRSHIQIHIANFTRQLEGCIAPGNGISDINHDGILDTSQSEAAFNPLMKSIDKTGTVRILAASQPGVGVYL